MEKDGKLPEEYGEYCSLVNADKMPEEKQKEVSSLWWQREMRQDDRRLNSFLNKILLGGLAFGAIGMATTYPSAFPKDPKAEQQPKTKVISVETDQVREAQKDFFGCALGTSTLLIFSLALAGVRREDEKRLAFIEGRLTQIAEDSKFR